jgi:hypothetical protein
MAAGQSEEEQDNDGDDDDALPLPPAAAERSTVTTGFGQTAYRRPSTRLPASLYASVVGGAGTSACTP